MEYLVSPREAADRIGVSVSTVKAWMNRADHPLPSVQVGQSGSHKRVVVAKIDEWLEAEASRKVAVGK